ncbi:MAG: class I SAM-dependent methyltransferase [Ignavibacteriaceae bacterium]|nr:class I SAM-dependent methyltransferase [Ignavibacteriaceae bacterium]
MPALEKAKNYDQLFHIYDHIMRNVNYSHWASYIIQISKKFVKNPVQVLEIGSGNCKLANQLQRHFNFFIASDYSFRMLQSAGNRTKHKVCLDMTSLPFLNKFDLIISAFDSINYLTSVKKLSLLFREVRSVLSEKGIFTFDVSLESNSYKYLKDGNRIYKIKNIKVQQSSSFNPSTRVHTNKFIIDFKANGSYIEVHKQKIFSFDTYFEIFQKSKLKVLDCLNAFTFEEGNKNSDRIQFVITKTG